MLQTQNLRSINFCFLVVHLLQRRARCCCRKVLEAILWRGRRKWDTIWTQKIKLHLSYHKSKMNTHYFNSASNCVRFQKLCTRKWAWYLSFEVFFFQAKISQLIMRYFIFFFLCIFEMLLSFKRDRIHFSSFFCWMGTKGSVWTLCEILSSFWSLLTLYFFFLSIQTRDKVNNVSQLLSDVNLSKYRRKKPSFS